MDTIIADKQLVCPFCETRGVIEGIAPEVVPREIKCGGCLHIFPYRPGRYDVLRQDYDGELNVWPMKVLQRGTKAPGDPSTGLEDPEAARLAALAKVSTKRLLDAYRAARMGDSVPAEISIQIPGFWPHFWMGVEVKAELATREHIPNKREARAARQTKARESQKRRYDL